MAPRKDMMRIIRQDTGFSAKLGFGGMAVPAADVDKPSAIPLTPVDDRSEATSDRPSVTAASTQLRPQGEHSAQATQTPKEAREAEREPRASADMALRAAVSGSVASVRGQVVYVAVSLTVRQAHLAEVWASAARCSVQFLIRRVAQGLREQVFEDWERNGMPDIDERRGSRGKHPTSVTLTLRPTFAANLAARQDPMGVLGLARVMGPAFRARFHDAFEAALETAALQSTTEGEER